MATLFVANYGDGTAAKANFDAALADSVSGDTIEFPTAGSATWSATPTIGWSLRLIGNGTVLTAGTTLNNGFFYVTGFSSAVPMQISGFDFNAVNFTSSGTCITIANGNVQIDNLEIDNCIFRFGYIALVCYGAKGVVHLNTFRNCLKAIDFSAGNSTQANASWNSMAAGTRDALFIEDNDFIYDASYPQTGTQESIGTENGGKLVVRYNNWDSTAIPIGTDNLLPVMTHGSAAGGVADGYWQIGTGARRGQSVVEIYNNTISGRRIDFLCILRGSANLVHDNTLDTATNSPTEAALYEEEQYEAQWVPNRTAWPAEDQVHNSFFWNNVLRLNGVPVTNSISVVNSSDDYIQEDRDYWMHAPQSSGGYESFTGANGASGAYPTNGVVWPTLGTMVFNAVGANAYYPYMPYTYPYPVNGDGEIGILTVANLRIG